ncbi:MAG: beta-ketoacyl synthase [Bacteroidales bacterium]|nr:beta-ketoacyl synthase [Bacteroidales bacterium]
MITCVGHNIISSLGFSSSENYAAVKSGSSGLVLYNSCFDSVEPFVASMIDKVVLKEKFTAICNDSNHYSTLEKAAILSVLDANKTAQIELSNARVLFVLSSTKGNVEALENDHQQTKKYLWHSAQRITQFFQNPNTPVIVSNACISGASAQIAALRELETDHYDKAVVIGADMLSKFVIAGFQSFKALSSECCNPFDVDRTGLNLGESAATIIYSKKIPELRTLPNTHFSLLNGVVRNDANHISGPSRTGEGCVRALTYILKNIDTQDIAFINAHGTATSYNDAMETVSLNRTGLNQLPTNSLKGYFGHTLGAAGVLETIISSLALADHTILASAGFSKGDDREHLNIVSTNQYTDKKMFIKMLSGFGGCNATLLVRNGLEE